MTEPTAAEKWDRFIEFQEWVKPYRDAEDKMILNHAPNCYGKWGSCISCGCIKSAHIACPSHAGNGAHTADVNERLIAALEAHAVAAAKLPPHEPVPHEESARRAMTP